jgi:spore coat-associated protein N
MRGTKKKLAITGAILASATALIGGGTFASFNAQTKNPTNTFATGTLVLSDTVGAGTACLSTGAGVNTDTNVNNSCSTIFALSVKKPGDSSTADITLKNEGTLAASALKIFSSAACANSDASGETYHGTGVPCAKVQLYIQQYSDSARTTVSNCLYGAAVTANTCDFTDATKTLAAFRTAYDGTTTLGAGTLAAGASRYFRIGVMLPSDADNTFQGRTASTDFTWLIEQ